jgi:IS30 family transposase
MLDVGCWMLDSSLEFSDHERIAESLGLTVCFTGPHALWKRGIDENTNELVRHYFLRV